jgi:hypothetical protein
MLYEFDPVTYKFSTVKNPLFLLSVRGSSPLMFSLCLFMNINLTKIHQGILKSKRTFFPLGLGVSCMAKNHWLNGRVRGHKSKWF